MSPTALRQFLSANATNPSAYVVTNRGIILSVLCTKVRKASDIVSVHVNTSGTSLYCAETDRKIPST